MNFSLFLVARALEVLPIAPPPPPCRLTEKEAKRLEEQEEDTLRELRLFLRDVTNRLSQDKRFKAFTKPVDLKEVVQSHSVFNLFFNLNLKLNLTHLYSSRFCVPATRGHQSQAGYYCSAFKSKQPLSLFLGSRLH